MENKFNHGICYYLRLNDKGYRKDLKDLLDKKYYSEKGKSFVDLPERVMKKITKEMSIEEDKGIALNRALRENLFSCFVSFINNIPLIIVGKPGTGKSLSFQILYNSMKGIHSEKPFFRVFGRIIRYYYQGSNNSTSKGIEEIFNRAKNTKEQRSIPLVFFDEMGLAERSINNPLKIIHFLLEKDEEDQVRFLGISNWRLDAAKINRALNLTITDYDPDDLQETALAIAGAIDRNISEKYQFFFEALAKTYYNYLSFRQASLSENKNFHGNRDFYSLIKIAARELIKRKNEEIGENKLLTQIGILSLERNFGGLEDSSSIIRTNFKESMTESKYYHGIDYEFKFSVIESIKENILDPNSRYLLLISEGNDGNDIIKFILESLGKNYIELIGSKYKLDIRSIQYSLGIALKKLKKLLDKTS